MRIYLLPSNTSRERTRDTPGKKLAFRRQRRPSSRGESASMVVLLEKGNLRLRTRLNDLEQILSKVKHSASSSRSAYDRKGISLYLPRENSGPLCPRADEQRDYEKSTRSTSLEVSTSTPGRVEISPQEQRMSKEQQTSFIETRLVPFKEESSQLFFCNGREK